MPIVTNPIAMDKENATTITTIGNTLLGALVPGYSTIASKTNNVINSSVNKPSSNPSYNQSGIDKIDSSVVGNSSSKGEAASPIYDIIENLYGQFNVNQYLNNLEAFDAYDISDKLFNYPFHLMDSCDIKPKEANVVNLGRQFMEKISAPAKILYMCPGVPIYMPGADKYTKNAVTGLMSGASGVSGEDLANSNYSGKYFDFRSDYPNYMLYVNGLCRALALLMGIGDEIGPDGKTPYKSYMWENYRYSVNQGNAASDADGNSMFSTAPDVGDFTNLDFDILNGTPTTVDESVTPVDETEYDVEISPSVSFNDAKAYLKEVLFGDHQYTQFYLDNNSSFSEEYSNSTMESTIKSKLDEASNKMKEVAFLAQVGGVSSDKFNSVRDEALEGLRSLLDGSGESNIFSRIFSGVSSVLSGAQLIMPQMWESSSHSKSYALSFYLYPPYGDTITVYEEVWVPLMHLMAYTLPRQSYKNPNSVVSPFLIRCFCKGQFSCQMGIVTSMILDKSDTVNANGLPSRIKVTLYIKDLYDEMSMSPANRPGEFINNKGLMDFLSNTAGINLATPTLQYTAKLLAIFMGNKITQAPHNIYNKMINAIRNSTKNIFGSW